MTTKITNHIQEALDRLIEQYKEATSLQSTVTAIVEQIQILEDDSFDLFGRLDINNGTGFILDKIGEIIGQPRNGLSDDLYRVFLSIKIGVNTSNGNPDKVIDIYKILSNSTRVQYQEFYPAGVGLEGDGDFSNSDLLAVYALIQRIVPAGVRVDTLAGHDPDCFFTFAGDPDGEGFGSLADANEGGCLGFLYDVAQDFGFGSLSTDENELIDGFGSLNDSILGGQLVGL